MDTIKLHVSKATALSGIIQQLSEKGDDKKPIFKLPFNFTYPCGRTLSKLQDALKPIGEANSEIFDGWSEEERKLQSRISAATGEQKEKAISNHAKAFKTRNDKWKKIANSSIDVEIYRFPKFTEEEKEEIRDAGLTPEILAQLEPMQFESALGAA